MLDRLRGIFIYAVALVLPLAGAALALVRFSQGEHDEGMRLTGATLLGVALYALLLA